MHALTLKRLMSIILIFIVTFFSVYVAPMEKVEAFAITGALLLGAAALLTASGIYALNSEAINEACVGLLNSIYESGKLMWDFFSYSCAIGQLIITDNLSDICNDFKQSLYSYSDPVGADFIPVNYLDFDTNEYETFYNKCFDFDITETSNWPGFRERYFGFTFFDGSRFYCSLDANINNYDRPTIPLKVVVNGLTTIYDDIYACDITRIFFDERFDDWFITAKGRDIALGISAAFKQLYDVYTGWTGTVKLDTFINPENFDFDHNISPPTNAVIAPPVIKPVGGEPVPATVPEDYLGKTAADVNITGYVDPPNELIDFSNIPLFALAAMAAAGINFTGEKALEATYYFAQSLILYYDLVSEAERVVDNLPTIVSWKYYPNGIPPDPPPDKPPKWNPFKTPGEPPWKACKEVVAALAWYLIQKVKDKFFGDNTGVNTNFNNDIVGITKDGHIIYYDNANKINNLTCLPFYKIGLTEFHARPDGLGTTNLYKNHTPFSYCRTSAENLYEGFILVTDGVDIVLQYISRVNEYDYDEIELHRIPNGLNELFYTLGSPATVKPSPVNPPQRVIFMPSVPEQLELGQAETITTPDDDRYEDYEDVGSDPQQQTKTITKYLEDIGNAIKNGFSGLGNYFKPPTPLDPDFDDPDPDDPKNKNNPLTLIFVFWKLLLACIKLLSRFGVFVLSLVNIPKTSQYIHASIIQGLEFGRNISVFGLFTIWGAFQSVLTALYCFFVVRIVSRNWRMI